MSTVDPTLTTTTTTNQKKPHHQPVSVAFDFPFDGIIITSPDPESAACAERPFQSELKRFLQQKHYSSTSTTTGAVKLKHVPVISTCDPYGARCGSGGGTVSAILEFQDRYGDIIDDKNPTLLILHAGGDSSRSPTQMITGKAFMPLGSELFRNPTMYLLHQLERLINAIDLPKGSVIVAATDCLLHFGGDIPNHHSGMFQISSDPSAVLGVAVPVPLTTAKNHGVYVFSNFNYDDDLSLEVPTDVLQKPSLQELSHVSFSKNFSDDEKEESSLTSTQPLAWVDTGIIIFLPKAKESLLGLAQEDGPLAMCTHAGLEEAFSKYQSETPTAGLTIQEFAKQAALQVDLYTDILQNLSWYGREKASMKIPSQDDLLSSAMNQLSLKVLVAPQGDFLHLGTTRELLDFSNSSCSNKQQSDLIEELQLQRIFHSAFQKAEHRNAAEQSLPSYVIQYSRLPALSVDKGVTIGSGSLLQHCDLQYLNDISIGRNVLLSGWRRVEAIKSISRSLVIPDNLSVQMVATSTTKHEHNKQQASQKQVCYVTVGMDDKIKDPLLSGSLYGIPTSKFLEASGLTLADLSWRSSKEDSFRLTLWEAQVHPILSCSAETPELSFPSVFGWIATLRNGATSITTDDSFKTWLKLPRISLKELHGHAIAAAEWEHRQALELTITLDLCSQTVLDKPEISIDEKKAVYLLVNVAIEAFESGHVTHSARALTVARALINRFFSTQPEVQDSPSANKDKELPMENILKGLKDESLSDGDLMEAIPRWVQLLDRGTRILNQEIIQRGLEEVRRTPIAGMVSSMINRWIIATAPARVDLAGGWTDTPPISYECELGSSVSGIAVKVDGFRPLCCRCRIISHDEPGVYLVSELRNPVSGDLVSHVSTGLLSSCKDLAAYSDPGSDCALLMCALIVSMIVSQQDIEQNVPLADCINSTFGLSGSHRLEIVSTSVLPQGSGLGSSSILGACVLASLLKCMGHEIDEEIYPYIFHGVLMMEQLLTTRGGHQDQVMGIAAGVKTVRTLGNNNLPIDLRVESIPLNPGYKQHLEERMFLIFTGKTRLAKNILNLVLYHWTIRNPNIVGTVRRLGALSEEAFDCLKNSGSIDALGKIISEYWGLKKIMAGSGCNVEPDIVGGLIHHLYQVGAIAGASLCGAGGGGFLFVIAKKGVDKESIERKLKEFADYPRDFEGNDAPAFSVHCCEVCDKGLAVDVLGPGNDGSPMEEFDLAWLQTSCSSLDSR